MLWRQLSLAISIPCPHCSGPELGNAHAISALCHQKSIPENNQTTPNTAEPRHRSGLSGTHEVQHICNTLCHAPSRQMAWCRVGTNSKYRPTRRMVKASPLLVGHRIRISRGSPTNNSSPGCTTPTTDVANKPIRMIAEIVFVYPLKFSPKAKLSVDNYPTVITNIASTKEQSKTTTSNYIKRFQII